jgi:hypothetical protein
LVIGIIIGESAEAFHPEWVKKGIIYVFFWQEEIGFDA